MQHIGAISASVLTFFSTLVFTPQALFQPNVLGESDDTTTSSETRSENRKEERKERVGELRTKRAEFKEEVRMKREEVKTERKAKRAEFISQLQTIRNEKKQKIAENVCDRFESHNTDRTTHLTNTLTRLSQLLEKVENRSEKASENGTDTISCQESIATAHAALSQAQNTVNSQSGKTYTCVIASEEKLGQTLGGTKQQLESDMKSVRATIHQAKTAVQLAARCLKGLKGVDEAE